MQTAVIFLAALLGILGLPVVAGVVYQTIGTWRDRRRFPPPGRNSKERPLTRARFFVRRIFASGRSPVRSRSRPPTSSLIARACEIHLCFDPRFFVESILSPSLKRFRAIRKDDHAGKSKQ